MNSIVSKHYRRSVAVLCILAIFWLPQLGYAESGTELEQRSALRICADPNSMPFSNRFKQGFENKIAALLATTLDLPVVYYWYPQSTGFVRVTLRSRQCDVIIGISAGNEFVLNTNPYYTSAFSILYPKNADYELSSLKDTVIREKNFRIGIIAGTPPAGILLEENLMEQGRFYHLVVDTRKESPAEQIVKDMVAGKLDIAVLWGPIAGHWNKKYGNLYKIVPLVKDHSTTHRMIYRITMGVRNAEINFKRQLNKLLRDEQKKIHAILTEYQVPMVEEL